jgi:ABC-2 type transport system permease protein
MGMKRILNIFNRDIKNSLRDNLLIYVLFMPIVMTLLLSVFFPETRSATVSIVVQQDMEQSFVQELENYGNVEIVATRKKLESRVNDFDDAIGIVREKGQYTIITQGNEGQESSLLPMIILDKVLDPTEGVKVTTTLIGERSLSVKKIISVFLLMMGIMIGAMVIGFNIVEDKSSSVINALSVAPLTKVQFIIGRSILGAFINILQTFVIMAIVGGGQFNFLHIFITILSSLCITTIMGFYIGGTSNDQISAIANMKIGNLFFMLVPAASMLIQESKHFLLYPFPTFWIYKSFRAILAGTSELSTIILYGVYTILTSILLFLVMLKIFKRAVVMEK